MIEQKISKFASRLDIQMPGQSAENLIRDTKTPDSLCHRQSTAKFGSPSVELDYTGSTINKQETRKMLTRDTTGLYDYLFDLEADKQGSTNVDNKFETRMTIQDAKTTPHQEEKVSDFLSADPDA